MGLISFLRAAFSVPTPSMQTTCSSCTEVCRETPRERVRAKSKGPRESHKLLYAMLDKLEVGGVIELPLTSRIRSAVWTHGHKTQRSYRTQKDGELLIVARVE